MFWVTTDVETVIKGPVGGPGAADNPKLYQQHASEIFIGTKALNAFETKSIFFIYSTKTMNIFAELHVKLQLASRPLLDYCP